VSKTVTAVPQRILMRPDQPGKGLLLDLLGGIHSVGGQPGPTGAPYWGAGKWNVAYGPVAVDMCVLSWDGPAGPTGWTLDCKGGIWPWAGTPATGAPYWTSSPWIADL